MSKDSPPSAPDARARIKAWLAACVDAPLDPWDDRYVTLDGDAGAPRGQDRKVFLFDTIDLATEDTTCQLFTGYSGSGKSTELRRLKAQLAAAGYVVLFADARDYHNLDRDLAVEELLPQLAGAFGAAAAAELGRPVLEAGWWDRFVAFLKREVRFDLGAGFGGAQVKAALHGKGAFLERLRGAMEGRLAVLRDEVHAFVAETVAALRTRHPDTRGVVFIFDNLEKQKVDEAGFVPRMHSVAGVFGDHAAALRLPGCHSIYSVPLYVGLLRPGIPGQYDGELQPLPTPRVTNRDPARTPHEPGVRAVASVLARRVGLDGAGVDTAFARPELVHRLVLAAGGHLRGLLELAQASLKRAHRDGLPISEGAVDAAVEAYHALLRAAVWKDGVPILESVRASFGLEQVARADLGRLAGYLDRPLVLCFSNGGGWYDVHPGVRADVARRARELREADDDRR